MSRQPGAVTFEGDPLTLVGDDVAVGDPAPDFTVLDPDLQEVTLEDLDGRIVVLLSVPSLDTPVCDTEVRRFNEEAAKLADDVTILTVSMDLPFAQKRWCGAKGVDRVRVASDHRDASFGQAYGLLIEELRLLARACLVLDRDGTVRHKQLVKEITEEPDYDEVLQAVAETA